MLKDTAAEKVRYIIDRMLDFRENEVKRLENNPDFTIGDVTTVNLTIMKGGIQTNVLPPALEIKFDVRLALDVDHNEFEATVNYFRSTPETQLYGWNSFLFSVESLGRRSGRQC